MYASLYEYIQSNESWVGSCETFESTLSLLNGTNNVTSPDLPGDQLYVCMYVCMCVCVCTYVCTICNKFFVILLV